MNRISSRFTWISERRGNQVGPIDASDLHAFRVIGVVLLLVSLVVTAVYAVAFDVAAYTTFRGELRTAGGTVTAVEPTDDYEPGTKWSKRDEHTRIVGIHYSFTDPDRVEREGISYLPGSRLTVGARLTVEHPAGRPEVSRIRGYRSAPYDRLPVPLYLMAGTGVVLLMFGLLRRRPQD